MKKAINYSRVIRVKADIVGLFLCLNKCWPSINLINKSFQYNLRPVSLSVTICGFKQNYYCNNMPKKKHALKDYYFLMAHGAGAGKDSDWMVSMSNAIESLGLTVFRFDFPYMQKRAQDGKRRPPDRMPKLLEAFRAQIDALEVDSQKLIIGGKSMGGRVASLLAAESKQSGFEGIICFGFPFTPPGKPEQFRGDHLKELQVPTLILQGERDKFGGKEMLESFQLSDKVIYKLLADGDHSFKPRVRSGYTLDDNIQTAAETIGDFLKSLSQP